jgi:predicted outer membrane lipoprotein
MPTPFRVSPLLLLADPGLSRCSNPGLKLANAFGVSGLELANAFGVIITEPKLANAFGVLTSSSNCFEVAATE